MTGGVGTEHEQFYTTAWSAAAHAEPGTVVVLGGRIASLRRHRRTIFADLASGDASIQIAFHPDDAPDLQEGHLVVLEGEIGRTRTGARTLFVSSVRAHRPVGTAVRADRTLLRAQSDLLAYLREVLARRRFSELQTSYLSATFEGGGSLPFTTWYAHRQQSLYLRVTAEPALLAAVAAGVPRCYELAVSFRNERRDRQHRPEFGLLEAYSSDLDYDQVTELAIELCSWSLGDTGPVTMSFADACSLTGVNAPPHDDPANQQLLLKVVGPRLPGLAVVERLPFPASPLVMGDGIDAERRWVFVNGAFCCEIARNELDPDALGMKLDQQESADRHVVERKNDGLLAVVSGLPPTSGIGVGTTRLLEAQGQLVGTSGHLI